MHANLAKTQLELEIDRIRGKFLAELDQRIEALDVFLFHLEETDAPVPALEGIVGILHKFSGVGSTLGFAELGEMAAKIEIQIGTLLSGPLRRDAVCQVVHDVDAMVNYLDGM